MPRHIPPRSPEEEEEYRRRRRERNTEIQRERRRRLKGLKNGENSGINAPTLVKVESPEMDIDSTPSPVSTISSLFQSTIVHSDANPKKCPTIKTKSPSQPPRRRRPPLLPTHKSRTPEEEALYAAQRRARNTEIQRRRRQRLREESMGTPMTSSSSSTDSPTGELESLDSESLLMFIQLCMAQIQPPPSSDGITSTDAAS